MRRIDRITIEERGISGLTLMERAGRAVANLILDRIKPRSIAVVTGKGNNAGDGFVVARILHRGGLPVVLFMLAGGESLSGDALTNFQSLPTDIPRIPVTEADQIARAAGRNDCIVDAILGTGVKGKVTGLFASVIERINSRESTVVAVDIPSGLPADAPYFDDLCVHADYTVTMGLPKIGMMQHPATSYCGEIVVADIGFPTDLLEAETSLKCNLVTPRMTRSLFPERPPAGHKGTFGSAFIIAGSSGMTGAAAMAAMAAARSGAGLVFVAVPESLNPVLEVKITEPITIPLPTRTPGVPDPGMLDLLLEKADEMDAVALGPGMGRAGETKDLIRELVTGISKPLVLDADGLNAFSGGHMERIGKRKAPLILTPHPGELARMIDLETGRIQKNRINTAREFAVKYKAVLVLKGAGTVIADPGGQIFINPTGNTALSKGGSGDILTGLIAGFLAQGLEPLESCMLGVYAHGLAGELAAVEKTEIAALPGDVLEQIPQVFKILTSKRDVK